MSSSPKSPSALPSWYPSGPTVYIVRGVSGSGKSSITRAITAAAGSNAVLVCSADDFFIDGKGVYTFDPTQLRDAHAYCKSAFTQAIDDSVPIIILDNTNTIKSHYKEYEDIVAAANMEIRGGHRLPTHWEEGAVVLASSAASSGTSSGTSGNTAAVAAVAGGGGGTYRLSIVELDCPDAATLYLFNSRQKHGVPWEAEARQWLYMEKDVRAIRLKPFLAPGDVESIEAARKLQQVRAVQMQHDQNPAGPPAFVPQHHGKGGAGAGGVSSNGHMVVDGNNKRSQQYQQQQQTSSSNSTSTSSSSAVTGNAWANRQPAQPQHHQRPPALAINTERAIGTPTKNTNTPTKGFAWGSPASSFSSSSSPSSSSSSTAASFSATATTTTSNFPNTNTGVTFPDFILSRINYIGLFLTKKGQADLLRTVRIRRELVNHFAEHCTVVHTPRGSDFTPQMAKCLGHRVQLEVYAIVWDERAQAVLVRFPAKAGSGGGGVGGEERRMSGAGNKQINTTNGGDGGGGESGSDDDAAGGGKAAAEDDDAEEEEEEGNAYNNIDEGQPQPDAAGRYHTGALREALSQVSENGLSKNNFAHITIATAQDTAARYSNDMIASSSRRIKYLDRPLLVECRLAVAVWASGPELRNRITRQDSWRAWVKEKTAKSLKTLAVPVATTIISASASTASASSSSAAMAGGGGGNMAVESSEGVSSTTSSSSSSSEVATTTTER